MASPGHLGAGQHRPDGQDIVVARQIQQQLQSVYASDSAYWSIHETIAKARA